jgi:hypothetical protein
MVGVGVKTKMPPMALPNLYASPADIFDYIGTEGTDLRLDDHLLASGQTIQATSDASVNATSINITALSAPLLRGTSLNFDGAGLPAVVQVVLSATAGVGALTLAVNPLPAQVNAQATAQDSGVNVALAQRLVKACQYGTSQVKLYCCSRYNDSDLATAWSPNRWATYLGAKWLCSRRGNSPPKSVAADAEEALAEMKQVRVGMLSIEDIGTRTSGWPFISNVRVDPAYEYAKIRVEQSLSEGTPTQYGQFCDWNSALLLEL